MCNGRVVGAAPSSRADSRTSSPQPGSISFSPPPGVNTVDTGPQALRRSILPAGTGLVKLVDGRACPRAIRVRFRGRRAFLLSRNTGQGKAFTFVAVPVLLCD
jgi:hypothetical protein